MSVCEVGYVCHDACVVIREKFWELVLSLCRGFLELNSGHWAWQQTSLPAGPPHQPLLSSLHSMSVFNTITLDVFLHKWPQTSRHKRNIYIWPFQAGGSRNKLARVGWVQGLSWDWSQGVSKVYGHLSPSKVCMCPQEGWLTGQVAGIRRTAMVAEETWIFQLYESQAACKRVRNFPRQGDKVMDRRLCCSDLLWPRLCFLFFLPSPPPLPPSLSPFLGVSKSIPPSRRQQQCQRTR